MRNPLALMAAASIGAWLAAAAPTAADDSYPTRSITLIVPFAPGGSTDAIARIVAEALREKLGEPVVVENRGGAGGSIGTAAIASAEPDGYTIGMGTMSTLAINPATYKDLPFDVLADLVPVGKIAEVPNIMSINPAITAADLAAFIALARAQPGKFSYASAGNGSVSHLLGEQFKLATGTNLVHVPYRGVGPALVDVVAGQVDVMFDNLPTSLPLARAGELRPLAVSGDSRVPTLPEVPTFSEVGLQDMNWMAFFGLVASKGTPDAIVRKLNRALADVVAMPQVRERLGAQQATVAVGSPEEFGAEVARQIERMGAAVEAAHIQPN